MISTALAIQEATGDAVVDLSTMARAKAIYLNKDTMTSDEFAEAMWEYSAHLSSLCATLVTNAILTETQMKELTNTIHEMEKMGKDFE